MADVEAAGAGVSYVALAPPDAAAAAYLRCVAREAHAGFARKVYGIRTAQLGLTVAVAAPIHQMPLECLQPSIWLPLATLACAGTMVSFFLVAMDDIAKKYPRNYLLLIGFTVSLALLLGLASIRDTAGMVTASLALLAIIFLCLTVYMWIFRPCVRGIGAYVQGGAITMSILGLAELLLLPAMGEPKAVATKLKAGGWILFFALLAVFDTQAMLGVFDVRRFNIDVDDFVAVVMFFYVQLLMALFVTFG